MANTKVLLWHWGRRGGGPRYTFELARALAATGEWEIHLSLSRQAEIFREFEALGLPGWHVDTYSGVASAVTGTLRLPMLRRRFWRYIAENRINVVACTMSHIWNVPVLIGRPVAVPYLLVLHDALPHPGDDVLLRHGLLKREVAYSQGVVALTEHVHGILCRDYGYSGDRTWVIPHGVFPYASPVTTSDGSSGRPLRLLFFGRILPYKGLDLLLSAYTALRRERQDVEILIAGSGDLRPYAAMIEGLDGVRVDNRWIPEEEIGPIFQRADLVVVPYREASQSGVIATAYAAGLPVVVTPIGGLVEQVKHEITGLICEDVSAMAIAAALRRMLDESDLRARCAVGAIRKAKEELAWSVIARRFGEALERVAALPPRGRGG